MGQEKATDIPVLDFVPADKGKGRYQVTARQDGAAVHSDVMDPRSDTQRRRFVKAVVKALQARTPDADAEAVEGELLGELLELADAIGKGKVAAAESGSAPAVEGETDPEVIAAVDKMLSNPNLLTVVLDDIADLGVAGERETAATVYLTGVSRLLDKPLAVIVQGPSSSGKSFVIEQTARLFPPETVIHATQLTPQALFHMPPGALVHRFVVAGERSRLENDDRAEATRALREMLSSGRLSKLMPMDVGKAIETVTIEQEGPIAYAESTTLTTIFEEDANRCLVVHTDERAEQTQRIINTLAKAHSGGGATPELKAGIVRRHHHLQRCLEAAPVVIPYAPLLGEKFGVRRVEARRAFGQVLNMVEALALLHQRQRDRDDNGAIVADVEDYGVARWLLLKPLLRYTGGLSDGARRFYDTLKGKVDKATVFTTTEAKRWETSSRSSVYGWLTMLHDAGLLERVEESRGQKPARWKLTGADIGDAGDGADLLPTVEEVRHCVYSFGRADATPN